MVSDGKCSGSNTGSTRSRHRRRLSIPRAAPWRRGGRSVAECVTSLAQSRGAARRRAARRTACGSAVNQPGHEQRGGDGCGQHQRGREDQPAQRRLPSRRPAHRPMAGGRSEARRRPEIGRPVLLATGRLPVVAFAFASHPPSIATISNAAHPRHGGRQHAQAPRRASVPPVLLGAEQDFARLVADQRPACMRQHLDAALHGRACRDLVEPALEVRVVCPGDALVLP
jgi:hypothetical protein